MRTDDACLTIKTSNTSVAVFKFKFVDGQWQVVMRHRMEAAERASVHGVLWDVVRDMKKTDCNRAVGNSFCPPVVSRVCAWWLTNAIKLGRFNQLTNEQPNAVDKVSINLPMSSFNQLTNEDLKYSPEEIKKKWEEAINNPDHPNIEEDGVTKYWAELPTTSQGSHKIEEAAGTVGHASASTQEEMNIAESRMNAVLSNGFGAAFRALNPQGAIRNMPQAKSSEEKAKEHFAFVEENKKRLGEVEEKRLQDALEAKLEEREKEQESLDSQDADSTNPAVLRKTFKAHLKELAAQKDQLIKSIQNKSPTKPKATVLIPAKSWESAGCSDIIKKLNNEHEELKRFAIGSMPEKTVLEAKVKNFEETMKFAKDVDQIAEDLLVDH